MNRIFDGYVHDQCRVCLAKLFLIADSRLVPLMLPKVVGAQLVISFRLDSSLGIYKKMF